MTHSIFITKNECEATIGIRHQIINAGAGFGRLTPIYVTHTVTHSGFSNFPVLVDIPISFGFRQINISTTHISFIAKIDFELKM